MESSVGKRFARMAFAAVLAFVVLASLVAHRLSLSTLSELVHGGSSGAKLALQLVFFLPALSSWLLSWILSRNTSERFAAKPSSTHSLLLAFATFSEALGLCLLVVVVLPNVGQFGSIFFLQGDVSLLALLHGVQSLCCNGIVGASSLISLVCGVAGLASSVMLSLSFGSSTAVTVCGTLAPLLCSAPLLWNFLASSELRLQQMARKHRATSSFSLQRACWFLFVFYFVGVASSPLEFLYGDSVPVDFSGAVGKAFAVALASVFMVFAASRIASHFGMVVSSVVFPTVLSVPAAWLFLPSTTCGFDASCTIGLLGFSGASLAFAAISFACTLGATAFAWRGQMSPADGWIWATCCGVLPVNFLLGCRLREPVECSPTKRECRVANAPEAVFIIRSFGEDNEREGVPQFLSLLARWAGQARQATRVEVHLAFEGGAVGGRLVGLARAASSWFGDFSGRVLVGTKCGLQLRGIHLPQQVNVTLHATDRSKTCGNRGEGLVLCLDSIEHSESLRSCSTPNRAIVLIADESCCSLEFGDVLSAAKYLQENRQNCAAVIAEEAATSARCLSEIYETGRRATLSKVRLLTEASLGSVLELSPRFSIISLDTLFERLKTMSPAKLFARCIWLNTAGSQADPVSQVLSDRIIRKSLAIGVAPLRVNVQTRRVSIDAWASRRSRELIARIATVASMLSEAKRFVKQSPFVSWVGLCHWTLSLLPTLLAPAWTGALVGSAVLCAVSEASVWIAFGCGTFFASVHTALCLVARMVTSQSRMPGIWIAVAIWTALGIACVVVCTIVGSAVSTTPLRTAFLAPHVVYLLLQLAALLPTAARQSGWALLQPLLEPFLETAVLAFALFPVLAPAAIAAKSVEEEQQTLVVSHDDDDDDAISSDIVAALCRRQEEVAMDNRVHAQPEYRCCGVLGALASRLDQLVATWTLIGTVVFLSVCVLALAVFPMRRLGGAIVIGVLGALPAIPAVAHAIHSGCLWVASALHHRLLD